MAVHQLAGPRPHAGGQQYPAGPSQALRRALDALIEASKVARELNACGEIADRDGAADLIDHIDLAAGTVDDVIVELAEIERDIIALAGEHGIDTA
jgi:polysaccharide deacetylase 2 family uncharacterized protein YibQ